MNTPLISLVAYTAIGAALAGIGQIFAPREERSLGGFLTVTSMWPIFVVGMIIIFIEHQLGIAEED